MIPGMSLTRMKWRAMASPWHRHDVAMTPLWYCHGMFIQQHSVLQQGGQSPWHRHDVAMTALWYCHGIPWWCHDNATARHTGAGMARYE